MKNLFISVLSLVLIFFFACSESSIEENDILDEITIRLQWKIQSQFAGYYIALDRGFYEEVGLSVKIEEGGYGQNNIITVQHGLEEFGTKWMADLIGEQADLISIANIVKSNGLILVSKKQNNIKKINDFIGKRVSVWFIGNEYQLFALLKKQGIDPENVDIVNQKWDMSQFFKDETDVSSAMRYNELLQIYREGYDPNELIIFDYADYNLDFPGHSIFTSIEYYENNKDICRRFVEASLRGWHYAVLYPEEAVDTLLKYDHKNRLDRDMQLQQMKIMSELINIEEYKLGFHRIEDIKRIADIYYEYGVIDNYPDIDSLFTNEFIIN